MARHGQWENANTLPAPPPRKRSTGKTVLLVIVGLFALGVLLNAVGIGKPEREPRSDNPGAITTGSDEWAEFPAGLQPSIDQYALDGDCAGLQATFDTVDGAVGAHPDVLTYIDAKMDATGCYG